MTVNLRKLFVYKGEGYDFGYIDEAIITFVNTPIAFGIKGNNYGVKGATTTFETNAVQWRRTFVIDLYLVKFSCSWKTKPYIDDYPLPKDMKPFNYGISTNYVKE